MSDENSNAPTYVTIDGERKVLPYYRVQELEREVHNLYVSLAERDAKIDRQRQRLAQLERREVRLCALEGRVAELGVDVKARQVTLEAALTEALALVRMWHGMRHSAEEEPIVWKLYQSSPEMTKIRELMAKAGLPT